jgi:hypothetical protein
MACGSAFRPVIGQHKRPRPVSIHGTEWLPGLCLCILLTVGGCATTPRFSTEGLTAIQVPFFPQETFQCGPASLATVINYWYGKTGAAKHLTSDAIAAEIYSPSARGVLGMDMERYARKQDFQTEQIAGSLDKLKENIDQGIPPIILVDYGFLAYQRNHFIVVKGYAPNGLLVNSGRDESKFIPNEELLEIWKKTGYWMLLIKP